MKKDYRWLLIGSVALGFWALVLAISIVFNVLVAFAFSNGINSIVKLLSHIAMHVLSVIFFLFVTFLTNRSCRLVRLNGDSLESRGLFFGFRKEVKVASVKRITKVFFPADGAYYVLEDGSGPCADRTKRESPICIPCSERGMEFIGQFYNGTIPPWYTDAPFP